MAPDVCWTITSYTNSTIQADNALWQGIKYDASYLLLDNTTIRDAAIAVRAQGTNQNTKFDIVNSQFLNNHNHLTISNQIDLSSTVHSSTFDVQVLPPYDNVNSAPIGIDIYKVVGCLVAQTQPWPIRSLISEQASKPSFLVWSSSTPILAIRTWGSLLGWMLLEVIVFI